MRRLRAGRRGRVDEAGAERCRRPTGAARGSRPVVGAQPQPATQDRGHGQRARPCERGGARRIVLRVSGGAASFLPQVSGRSARSAVRRTFRGRSSAVRLRVHPGGARCAGPPEGVPCRAPPAGPSSSASRCSWLAALGAAPAVRARLQLDASTSTSRPPAQGHVRTELELEYDLLVVSAADAEHDDALFQDGTAAFDDGDAGGAGRGARRARGRRARVRHGRASRSSSADADLHPDAGRRRRRSRSARACRTRCCVLDHACAASRRRARGDAATLFARRRGLRHATPRRSSPTTSTASTAAPRSTREHPSFSTEQTTVERFWEFFHLGAEHLLTGHRPHPVPARAHRRVAAAARDRARRDDVHARALGDVHARRDRPGRRARAASSSRSSRCRSPSSPAGTCGGSGSTAAARPSSTRPTAATSASTGPAGCGSASSSASGSCTGSASPGRSGIDEAWSWTLLWSLLVFNVGIEAVQLAIIAARLPAARRAAAPRTAGRAVDHRR